MKIRLKYLKSTYDKKSSRWFYYYRRDGHLLRLPDEPLTTDFRTKYEAIHASFEEARPLNTAPGSVKALVIEYMASRKYRNLAKSSQQDYRRFLDRFVDHFGDLGAREINTPGLVRYRDKIADKTPRTADMTVAAVRAVWKFGLQRGLVDQNVAIGIERAHETKDVDHREPWSMPEFEMVLAHEGTSDNLRLALLLGLYTGQRLSDVAKIKWSDIDGDMIAVVQNKTKAKLKIPMHDRLRVAISDAKKTATAITILTTETTGQPIQPKCLSRAATKAAHAVGLTDRTFHGLRKSAAIAMYMADVDKDAIMAVTGHETETMLRLYLKGADQTFRARDAIERWQNKAPGKVSSFPNKSVQLSKD